MPTCWSLIQDKWTWSSIATRQETADIVNKLELKTTLVLFFSSSGSGKLHWEIFCPGVTWPVTHVPKHAKGCFSRLAFPPSPSSCLYCTWAGVSILACSHVDRPAIKGADLLLWTQTRYQQYWIQCHNNNNQYCRNTYPILWYMVLSWHVENPRLRYVALDALPPLDQSTIITFYKYSHSALC